MFRFDMGYEHFCGLQNGEEVEVVILKNYETSQCLPTTFEGRRVVYWKSTDPNDTWNGHEHFHGFYNGEDIEVVIIPSNDLYVAPNEYFDRRVVRWTPPNDIQLDLDALLMDTGIDETVWLEWCSTRFCIIQEDLQERFCNIRDIVLLQNCKLMMTVYAPEYTYPDDMGRVLPQTFKELDPLFGQKYPHFSIPIFYNTYVQPPLCDILHGIKKYQ